MGLMHPTIWAQQPNSQWFFSYTGEMITHPGFKLGLHHGFKQWESVKEKKNGKNKKYVKQFVASPGLGVFYHRRYQTAVYAIQELSYECQKPNGRYRSCGLGLGYMRTFIPNTYEVKNGKVERTTSGDNYLIIPLFVTVGRKPFGHQRLGWFAKPGVMLSMPGFPMATGYFLLEMGITKSVGQ